MFTLQLQTFETSEKGTKISIGKITQFKDCLHFFLPFLHVHLDFSWTWKDKRQHTWPPDSLVPK